MPILQSLRDFTKRKINPDAGWMGIMAVGDANARGWSQSVPRESRKVDFAMHNLAAA
jgi:hypothetical protein